jgi:hypothetical protein
VEKWEFMVFFPSAKISLPLKKLQVFYIKTLKGKPFTQITIRKNPINEKQL